MNIHEYQAKELFQNFGIAIPDGQLATSTKTAIAAAEALGGQQWVVKAQVHAGGCGKVGGVKLVDSLDAVANITAEMLGTHLVTKQTDAEGLPINSVLIEKTYTLKREFYLSIILDRATERVMFIASSEGGMDIEAVAEETPEKIITLSIHPATGLQAHQCREVGFNLGLSKAQMPKLAKVMQGMYALMLAKDASQIEINPLVEIEDEVLLAIDAKINFDDNAVAIHPEILAYKDPSQEDAKENEAAQFDLNYITLSGDIGCMVNGAGLAMATMDLIKLNGGFPANFLDVGGGTNTEKVTEAFKLIVSDSNIKAVLVNIFGGIVKCDVIATGILAAVAQIEINIPIVVRLEGTNAEAGRKLLSDSNMAIIAADDLATAAEQVVKLAENVA